ncbi:unnamed protein product [Sympodiomycopsis kandeliae]
MPNMTCPVDHRPVDPRPFYSNGSLQFKAHDVGWIVSGFFTLIACVVSFWLIFKHLTYYTYPLQQRHIVRMLFMVPIYAIVSWMSYLFFRQAVYYETIRDCYEAVVITSFFYLLLQYVGDTRAEQHEVFRNVKLKKWFWPMGFWKYRPTGLHFLWLMKISILQYAIVRPVCTIVAVVLEYFGIYCLDSWAPYFGHIWISISIALSVTVAMYCIIQFYIPIEKELKPYSPVLKFLAVKSVVFLTFWQDSFLSVLVFFKVIKATEYMTADEIQAGINALLETFEMVIFAFLHIKAFTYLIYRPQDHSRTTGRWRALLDVIDFRDWARQMKESSRYVYARSRGREFTVVEDIRADKHRHLAEALGKERAEALRLEIDAEKEEGAVKVPWKNPDSVGDSSPTVRDLELGTQDGGDSGTPAARSQLLGQERPSDPQGNEDDSLLRQDAEPTRIPTLDYTSGDRRRERHPELSQYHRTALHDHHDHPEDDEDQAAPPSHPREKSLGQWWRSIRNRISGSQYEDARQVPDENEEEDRGMMTEKKQWGNSNMSLAPLDLEIARHFTQHPDQNSSGRGSATESILKSRPSPLSNFISVASAQQEGRDELEGKTGFEVVSRPRIVPSHSQERFPEFRQRGESRVKNAVVSSPLREVEQADEQQLPTQGSVSQVPQRERHTETQYPQSMSPPVRNLSAAQALTVIPGRTSGPSSEQASVSGLTGSGPSRQPSSSACHPAQRELAKTLANANRPESSNPRLEADRMAKPVTRPVQSTALKPPPPRQNNRAVTSSNQVAPDAYPIHRTSLAMSFSPSQHSSERATPESPTGPSKPTAGSVRSSSSLATAPPVNISSTGPKGKSIQIKVPDPLSPARFPYGMQGDLPDSKVTSQPLSVGTRNGSVKFEQTAAVATSPSFDQDPKARILSGPMSLKKARAAGEQQSEMTTSPAEASRTSKMTTSPTEAPRTGGLFRLPGRSAKESEYKTPLPAPSQMGGVDDHPELFIQPTPTTHQDSPPRPPAQDRQRSSFLNGPKHPSFNPAPTGSTFEVGQIITPVQRMTASYQVRPHQRQSQMYGPPPPLQNSRQFSQPVMMPSGQFATPRLVASQPRHSLPPPNLRGETSYDRWTGEPTASYLRPSQHQGSRRYSQGQGVPSSSRTGGGRRESLPAPSQPIASRYDTKFQIEYID